MPKRPEGGFTVKEDIFMDEYLIDSNATQAAMRAGYSENTAHVIGPENLAKPEIAAEVQNRRMILRARCKITQEMIVENIVRITGNAEKRGKVKDSLKGNELLAKVLGILTERRVSETTEEFEARITDARKRLQEHKNA